MTLCEWEQFKRNNTDATLEMLREILMESDTQKTVRALRGGTSY
jgi:hypothetical protein